MYNRIMTLTQNMFKILFFHIKWAAGSRNLFNSLHAKSMVSFDVRASFYFKFLVSFMMHTFNTFYLFLLFCFCFLFLCCFVVFFCFYVVLLSFFVFMLFCCLFLFCFVLFLFIFHFSLFSSVFFGNFLVSARYHLFAVNPLTLRGD